MIFLFNLFLMKHPDRQSKVKRNPLIVWDDTLVAKNTNPSSRNWQHAYFPQTSQTVYTLP